MSFRESFFSCFLQPAVLRLEKSHRAKFGGAFVHFAEHDACSAKAFPMLDPQVQFHNARVFPANQAFGYHLSYTATPRT